MMQRIVYVQEHTRAERLPVTALYNRSFLAVVHVVSATALARCREVGVLCKPCTRLAV